MVRPLTSNDTTTRKMVQVLKLLIIAWWVTGSNLVGTPTVLTGVFHGFSQSLDASPYTYSHLSQYSNRGPSNFHTILQPGRHRVNTFPQEVRRNGKEKSPICGSSSVSGQTSCFALPLLQQSHGVRLGVLMAVLLVLYIYYTYTVS
jgi:hypothetical protein